MKKRVESILLALVMLVSMFPAITLTAEAAESDPFGLEIGSPSISTNEAELKENPYGSLGWVRLVTENELIVTTTAVGKSRTQSAYDYNTITDRKQTNTFSNGSGYSLLASVAFDPLGNGRDEYVASIAFLDSTNELWLYVSDQSGIVTSKLAFSCEGLRNVASYNVMSHMAITAGDYNGDGKDTMMVYNISSLNVVEYSFNGFSLLFFHPFSAELCNTQ